jgi:hypothetical protein
MKQREHQGGIVSGWGARPCVQAGTVDILKQTKYSKLLDSKHSKQITQDIHIF